MIVKMLETTQFEGILYVQNRIYDLDAKTIACLGASTDKFEVPACPASGPAKIAILVPTFGRAAKLRSVAENIHKNTQVIHNIYFIIEAYDTPTLEYVKRSGEHYIINGEPHTYVNAINSGYKQTHEPYVFCAADDLNFTRNWDTEALAGFKGKIGIVGVNDNFPVTKSKMHACHFMVKRTYIEKHSGVLDEPNVIYSSQYQHLQCDAETLQTAIKRGAFFFAEKSWVEHQHWFVNSAVKKDATYERAMDCLGPDNATYDKRRRKCEVYNYDFLWQNKFYRVDRPAKLSIVLPSFNALNYLQQTLKSLEENTYYPYELIIIDDVSNAETVKFIKGLKGKNLTKIFNKRQMFTNANWNKGINLAKNEYVAVINNDISFSKWWDVPLVAALDDKDTLIASPYQTDDGERRPYGKADRSGNIDIRGACYMAKKVTFNKIGPIPSCLKLWCGDSWLAKMVTDHFKKKSLFIADSTIHHYGSKSSLEWNSQTKKLKTLTDSDREAFAAIRFYAS